MSAKAAGISYEDLVPTFAGKHQLGWDPLWPMNASRALDIRLMNLTATVLFVGFARLAGWACVRWAVRQPMF